MSLYFANATSEQPTALITEFNITTYVQATWRPTFINVVFPVGEVVADTRVSRYFMASSGTAFRLLLLFARTTTGSCPTPAAARLFDAFTRADVRVCAVQSIDLPCPPLHMNTPPLRPTRRHSSPHRSYWYDIAGADVPDEGFAQPVDFTLSTDGGALFEADVSWPGILINAR